MPFATCQIWGHFCMHLLYTGLALATLERSGDLIIGYAMANIPYKPNLGSLLHPDGLEEALLVHQPGPGHLGEVW